MRVAVAGLLLLLAGMAWAADQRQPSPYRAIIAVDNAYIRCGPGEQYYPTDKVRSGMEVEVYRDDPSGWCAIKPPPGSFSWIAGRYLKLGEEGLAEVLVDGVPARIGSRFSAIRNVAQVRLNRGETVEVQGSRSLAEGGKTEVWHKIAPPSGEFRWVAASDIRRAQPRESAINEAGQPTKSGQRRESGVHIGAAEHASDTGTAESGPAEPGVPLLLPGPTDTQRPLAAGGETAPAGAKPLSAEQFQREHDDISDQIAMMLAEEPTVWNFTDLAERVRVLIERAPTAVERGRAGLLANRIEQASELRKRYELIGFPRRATGGVAQVGPAPPAHMAMPSLPPGDGRFDGEGRLRRVVAASEGSPRYALVDETGSVRCYVNPAPGVNMNYYVGRRVGVTGARAYEPRIKAEMVTAKHVTPLETRMR